MNWINSVLNPASLAGTLWNLEEARFAGVPAETPYVRAALDWLVARHGEPGAYHGVLFAPAENDWSTLQVTPTGEDSGASREAMMHILGEEATRALLLWGQTDGWDAEETLDSIRRRFCPEHAPVTDRLDYFCCARCSVAWWRALNAGKPEGWEPILTAVVNRLRNEPLDKDRWQGLPFYYTLLSLSEMPPLDGIDIARKRIVPAAEHALAHLTDTGIAARFRRRALQWAVA